jgi:D5 N terminal like
MTISNITENTDNSVLTSIIPQNDKNDSHAEDNLSYAEKLQRTIAWLDANNFAVLPVAPRQDPLLYPEKKDGVIQLEADGVTPKPEFTGKSPSFLDQKGIPHLVTWRNYKKESPSKELRDKWFSNPLNGIGTLGKEKIRFLDFDLKNFDSQEHLDSVIETMFFESPKLRNSYIEKTQGGGYHIGVQLKTCPEKNFKNFALENGGKHVGEVIIDFCVLAPTVGIKGNYSIINRGSIVEVPCLEDIGIFPRAKPKPAKETKEKAPKEPKAAKLPKAPKVKPHEEYLELETLISDKATDILKGDCGAVTDRSEALTTFCNEAQGWLNWCKNNKVAVSDDYEELARKAGESLGIDQAKIDRILATIGQDSIPSAEHGGGDESCWKRIYKVNKDAYRHKCPDAIKSKIVEEIQAYKQKNKDIFEVDTTAEDTMLKALFDDGEGNWKVIKDAYHQYSEKGYWKFIGDDLVQKSITDLLRKFYWLNPTLDGCVKKYTYSTDATKTSTFKFCRSNLTQTEVIYNEHLLCFRNGTVDVRTGELSSHNREDFITSSIDVDYKKNSPCPEVFKSFICNSFGEQFLPLIRGLTAMYLDPTAPYGYFAHIIGQSGSGKGTLIRFWGEMFGIDNVRSLQKFEDVSTPEKRHQMLTGIKFCSFPDMGGFQKDLRAFYELVDNGGLSGRALFSSTGYERRWNSRFAIASVDYLTIENSGDGWARRAVQIPTLNRVNEVDTELGQKLKNCTAEVISWALSMPRNERDNLIKNAGKIYEEISDAQTQQKIMGDSVSAFVESCLRPSPKANSKLETSDLYDDYVAFCKAQGMLAKASTGFLSHLKIVIPNNFVARKSVRENGSLINKPSHYNHIDLVDGSVFNYSNSYEPSLVCNKKKLSEGGIKAFATFWQQMASGSIVAEAEVKKDNTFGKELTSRLSEKGLLIPKSDLEETVQTVLIL